MTTKTRKPRGAVKSILVMVVVMVVAVATTWVVATKLQSPDQVAAAAKAPTPTRVLAEVQHGSLSDVRNATASIVPENSVEVTLSTFPESPTVTANILAPGETATNGSVLLAINDRPLWLIEGAFPLYRDLAEGDSGADVELLQKALNTTGAKIPKNELGKFGVHTTEALKKWYKSAGFAPLTKDVTSESTGADGETVTTTKTLILAPKSEFLSINGVLPAKLESTLPVGTLVSEETKITFSTGELMVTSQIPNTLHALFGENTKLSFTDPSGTEIVLKETGFLTQTDSTEGTLYLKTADGSALNTDLAGQATLLNIELRVVATDSLLVPSRAIGNRDEEQSYVLKQENDDYVRIEVQVLGELNGVSAITNKSGTELTTGNRVVIDAPTQ